MKPEPNYRVTTQGWFGRQQTDCSSEKEAWEVIGRAAFGSLYEVSSPVGLPVNHFIPF